MAPRPLPGHERPGAREAISEAHLTQRPSAFGALTVVRCVQRSVGRSRHGQRKCLQITENLFHVHAQCRYRRKDGRFETKRVGGESHGIDLPPHTHIVFSRYSPSALLLQRAWVTIIHPNPKLILGLPHAKATNPI
jgi:hypothetical protein